MKNFCLNLFTLLILITQSEAQTALTDYQGSGSNNRNEIVEVDSVLYLISINSLNEASIYRIDSPEDRVFLHSETLGAVYSVSSYILEDEYLITEGNGSVIVYNFITDERVEYEAPTGYNIRYLSSSRIHNSKVKVSLYEGPVLTSDNQSSIGLDITTGWIGTPRSNFIYSDNWEYEVQYFPIPITIIKNESFASVDTFFQEEFRVSSFLIDEDAMYHHKDSMIIKYEPGQELDTLITTQSIYPQDRVLDQMLYDDEDNIYVSETYSDYVDMMHVNEIRLTCIAKQSGEIVRDTVYAMDDSSDHFSYDTPEYIFYEVFADDLIVVNKQTFEMKRFDSDLGDSSLVFQDPEGRLINTIRVQGPYTYNNRLQLIDLESEEVIDLDYTFPFITSQARYAKIFEVDSQYLLNIYHHNQSEHISIYDIDPSTNFLEPNTNLDSSNSGYSLWSSVLDINGTPTLVAEEIQYVDENGNVNLLFEGEITDIGHSKFAVKNGLLYIHEKDTDLLWQWDGSTFEEIMDLSTLPSESYGFPSTMSDFVLIDDKVLISTYRTFFLFDRVTQSYEEVDGIVPELDESELVTYGDYVYFLNYDGLHRIDGQGQHELIYDDQNINLLFSISNTAFRVIGEKLVANTGNALIEITSTGDYSIIIEETQGFENSLSSIYSQNEEAQIVIPEMSTQVYVYNSVGLHQYEIGYSNIKLEFSEKQYHFFSSEEEDFVINSNTHEVTDLSGGFELEDIFGVIERNANLYILVHRYGSPNSFLDVYNSESDFNNIELFDSFSDVGWFANGKYIEFYDEGVIYSGNKIIFVDEEFGLHPTEEISGLGGRQQVIAERDGSVYFLAIDPQNGVQLYSDVLVSFRTSVTDLKGAIPFSVSPNPATATIKLNLEVLTGAIFKLYNQSGTLVLSGEYSSSLNVIDLEAGMYHLIVNDGTDNFAARFIKN